MGTYTSPTDPGVVLVGLGPHAKRIYLPALQHAGITPRLIIDLESNRESTLSYLSSHGIHAEFYGIDPAIRDCCLLPNDIASQLSRIINQKKITKAIISTEPKAHLCYALLFLDLKLSILMDKPLTAPVGVSSDESVAWGIFEDYKALAQKYEQVKSDSVQFVVQSQRRYHTGFNFIKNQVDEIIHNYQIPISFIQINHSDGMWTMPNEFDTRENHPHKYGYGKLLHSGYHFIDLFSWLTSSSTQIASKEPNNIQIYHQSLDPNDALFHLDQNAYEHLLPSDKIRDFFAHYQPENMHNYGEVDSYSLIQLMHDDRIVTTGSINLLQQGFSRRAWADLPKDTYKGNGRIRHEELNLHIGPLMNIQVHSYQAYEIRDPEAEANRFAPGGLNHFDIYIFRNTALIGGQPFEQIALRDLKSIVELEVGHNEKARYQCLYDFLDDKPSQSDLLDHSLTNFIIAELYACLAQKKKGSAPYSRHPLPR